MDEFYDEVRVVGCCDVGVEDVGDVVVIYVCECLVFGVEVCKDFFVVYV